MEWSLLSSTSTINPYLVVSYNTKIQSFKCDNLIFSISISNLFLLYPLATRSLLQYSESIDLSYFHGSRRAFAYGAFSGGIGLFAYSAVALVLWYGGSLVVQQKGDMDSGTLVTFLLYTIYVAGALGGLSGLFGNLMNAVGASERMFELLDMVPKINTASGTGYIPKDESNISRIEFKNVSFSYPTRKNVPVLKNISFVCCFNIAVLIMFVC